jgi:hypothetical protein
MLSWRKNLPVASSKRTLWEEFGIDGSDNDDLDDEEETTTKYPKLSKES